MEQAAREKVRRRRREPVEKKPPPVGDAELAGLDPACLARDELVWAMGRAATLQIAEAKLWKGFAKAVAQIGEQSLTPSEVCRLVQAFAYAPAAAPIDERQLQRLLRAFATRAKDYSDERLMRLIYGYSKLAAKRGLGVQRFLEFATTEVVERKSMKAWRKFRILRAVTSLPGAVDEFRSLLVVQITRDAGNLDAESLRAFVPMLVEFKVHQRPGVLQRLNKMYKQKLFSYKTPDLVLRTGVPFLLHDLLKTTTLRHWLERLHDLRLPITPGMAEAELPPPSPASWAEAGDEEEDEDGDEGMGLTSPACRAAQNLEALKIVELCLRHERPETLAILPAKAQHLLLVARRTPLEPPEEFQMLELPFVFASLGRLFKACGVLLHPTVYGPYLLELADPLGRVVVEWDSNWALYPPWRRKMQEEYVRRKHIHLKAEGWKVVCVPLATFQALKNREAKLEYLDRFIWDSGLEHLRLPP